MAKIIQNNDECIGCGSCAMLCPKFWEMDCEKGKAFLKGAQKNKATGEYELDLPAQTGTKNIDCNKDASDACPVGIIRIEK
ncbi:ferredoxin [Patescibacteria group bacterium]|nr:ferredoxin [Patescibacteria group bacterium]MBU4476848.1 ferredoxin [Patescibacteria group bacterium]MCG2699278.1 ferredoxin [Candidatus Parcubacteria bacterium]